MSSQEDYRNIQEAMDTTLNIKSIVRRKKKNHVEKKKEAFVQVVLKLEEVAVKSMLAYADLQIDLSKYEEKFYEIMDTLMLFSFGPECTDLISFYVWDRVNPEGGVNPVMLEESGPIYLNNPYELWDLMILVNPNLVL